MTTANAASAAPPPVDLPYRIIWRSRALRQGAHRSTQSGAGGLFRDLATLLEYRDPRRIDLRQTLRDPFGTLHVRRFEEKSQIGVTMLLDVSGSMGFHGASRKMGLAADLAQVFATAVRRAGDTFALYAADDHVHEELSVPPTRSRAGEAEMIAALRAYVPKRRSASALVEAARRIGQRRNLVVIVSDFLLPDAELEALFETLIGHDVVPIRIVDSRESAALPSWGLLELADLETGRRRLVAMRPSLKAEWQRRIEARRSFFRTLAARYGREPFEITDSIPWDRLGAHLAAGA
ncbi:MAG: VWA domain-containing protein [Rhizobiales bacterium]|nr:VWA domain-containing protein [Hyphomicrobiales bacterium]